MANARHPKSGGFVQQKLFAAVSNFAELEQRITALPDKDQRGDALEVFAEAYLATQRKHDADTVWPFGTVPTDVLAALKLGTQDYGVDGVLRTRLGQHSVYQVKFRTGRPSLTWREVSTFTGLADSPAIHSRILFTNCDDLPAVLNDRQGFFCIRGTDLDRLEAQDFQAIEAWLADSAFVAPKKTPQLHQTEALGKILPALQQHDRVSAIMACGTGKTLVALWVAEHVAEASSPAGSGGIPAARILVLLPSLALLRQTLHEWLRETSLPSLAYLCVCSDPTVKDGTDALHTQQSDLDFEVSTNAASVRRFLDAPFVGVRLVFSTYQSASEVGKAMKAGERFDLGIFDEAHKTAGREGRNFAFALEDKNLPIHKRLFLTATPRHYNPQKRDKEGEAKLVFSMNRPEVYGPQAYVLTFAEAARRIPPIICGYKVIISVITSQQVTNELLTRGEVLVGGETVDARRVANQIALRDAVHRYGVRRIFTFHRTVKDAAHFVAEGGAGIRQHLKNFRAFHVNGKMTAAHRERLMREFRQCEHGLMSNARCLAEGVDVPAVDMVAFLSPRRSLVDIVQATGRAMRKADGKELGYVLVPLYVDQAVGESLEEAVRRAQYDEIWDVLQSLQEQDDVLAEAIRELSERKGQGKEVDASHIADRVDFGGPRLELETLRTAIAARCLDRLWSSWETGFGKLRAFKERFGHCRVETGWKEDPALWSWVSAQRGRRKRGELLPRQIHRLDELGFVWDWQAVKADEIWMQWYHKLEAYKAQHRNCRVRQRSDLGQWVAHQRADFKRSKLSEDRIARLNALGFEWNIKSSYKRVDRLAQLRAFRAEHGHCRVPQGMKGYPGLAAWVVNQRWHFNKGVMPAERIAELNELGFDWGNAQENAEKVRSQILGWSARLAQLQEFKAKRGDCRVPDRWKENPSLAKWVSKQRQLYKKKQLKPDRIARLEALGFDWDLSFKRQKLQTANA